MNILDSLTIPLKTPYLFISLSSFTPCPFLSFFSSIFLSTPTPSLLINNNNKCNFYCMREENDRMKENWGVIYIYVLKMYFLLNLWLEIK